MSQTIAGAVAALQTIAGGLSGINYAPDNPQDNVVQLPYAITFPETGSFEGGFAHQSKNLVTLVTELHFAYQNMAEAVSQATPYGDSFLAAVVADSTLSGTVMAVVYPITWEFGMLTVGSDQHIGYKFHIPVKLENAF